VRWINLTRAEGLLYGHPQVYVDVVVINWTPPRKEFHAYLRRLVEAGYGKRIMFGSDQMVWPEAIGMAVDAINAADFLTAEQKADIFYNNAALSAVAGRGEVGATVSRMLRTVATSV
jgi:uncharacterized protein